MAIVVPGDEGAGDAGEALEGGGEALEGGGEAMGGGGEGHQVNLIGLTLEEAMANGLELVEYEIVNV